MKKIYLKGDIITNDYKYVYNYFGWDSTCPNDIINELNKINGSEEIIIDLNSPGGSVIPAHEIYTAIREYTGEIEIHVVGVAGSAASEILTACRSLISPVGGVMIHNCATEASGDYREMDSTSQMLKSINQAIRNAYKAKTGLSDEELKDLMDKTTWMSAQEAVDMKFVDGIMFESVSEEDDPDESRDLNIFNRNKISVFNSIGSSYLNQNVLTKLQDLIKKDELKNLIPGNNEPVNQSINTDEQACILNSNTTIQGGKEMKLEDLIKEHPEVQNEVNQIKDAAKQEGFKEGESAERIRIQAIDNIANSVNKDLLNKAKYTEPMNASELALKVITDTANSGRKYMADAITDSDNSGVDDVTTTPTDSKGEDEDDKLVDIAAGAANRNRKAVK